MLSATMRAVPTSPAWTNYAISVVLLLLTCLVPVSITTNSNVKDVSLKDPRDMNHIILSKLEDIDNKISRIDVKIRRLDDTIENDIKKKIFAIEAKAISCEGEPVVIDPIDQRSPDTRELRPINALLEDTRELRPMNDLLENIERDRNSFNAAIGTLTLSATNMAMKMDIIKNEITKELSQEMYAMKAPIEQINSVVNTSLLDIRTITQESQTELKQEMKSFNNNFQEILLRGNKTIEKLNVIESEMSKYNNALQNQSSANDLRTVQIENVQETIKDEMSQLSELIRSQTRREKKYAELIDEMSQLIHNQGIQNFVSQAAPRPAPPAASPVGPPAALHDRGLRARGKACAAPFIDLGHLGCYFFPTESASWDTARTRCQNYLAGSDLAVIHSATARQEVIKSMGIGDHRTWLGGTNRSGQWAWLDGQPIHTGAGWANGQPDGNFNNYCLYLNYPQSYKGTLWDNDCNASYRFLCQKYK